MVYNPAGRGVRRHRGHFWQMSKLGKAFLCCFQFYPSLPFPPFWGPSPFDCPSFSRPNPCPSVALGSIVLDVCHDINPQPRCYQVKPLGSCRWRKEGVLDRGGVGVWCQPRPHTVKATTALSACPNWVVGPHRRALNWEPWEVRN